MCVASPGHAMGHCKIKCSLYSAQQEWWRLHWVLRQGCWAVGSAVVAALPDSILFRWWRLCSATTVHRALPVCVLWPALGMPWDIARSNAVSAVTSRCDGVCSGCSRRAGQVVLCGGCGFARLWTLSVMEAVLGNQCAQSPASVCVASPGHAMGHCKV